MSIVINAKGTSVPFFRIGKTGITLYQGPVDPSLTYTPINSDVWINTSTNALEMWSAADTAWRAPRLADLHFSGSALVAGPTADLTLRTDAGNSVILDAAAAAARLTAIVGKDLHINESIGGSLYLNTNKWPPIDGSVNQALTTNGAGVLSWSPIGTVTSVGLVDISTTSIFSITNSPVTTSGSLTVLLSDQLANTAFLAPTATTGQPTFRQLEYVDLPVKLYVENPVAPVAPIATGTNSSAFGASAKAVLYGSKAYANGQFSNPGDSQHGVYILRNSTTNSTPTPLFLDGSSEQLVMPFNSVVSFSIVVAARQVDVPTGGAGYKFDGVIKKDGTHASLSFIGVPSKTILGETDIAWDITLASNTSTGAIEVIAVGENTKTIRWTATVLTTEVSN